MLGSLCSLFSLNEINDAQIVDTSSHSMITCVHAIVRNLLA
jgi:hypothetical protein